MKAPDKIYLNKYMIRPGMLYPAEFPPDNPEEEYIRKGALLEWANEALAHLSDGSLTGFYESLAYKDIIDKLNSM